MASRVVHKYAVPDGEGSFGLDLPHGAIFAGLTVQNNEPYMYFVIDPEAERWRYKFHARDTGQPLDVGEYADCLNYLGFYRVVLNSLKVLNVRHVWMEL